MQISQYNLYALLFILINNYAIKLHNCHMWITRNAEKLIKEYKKQFSVIIITGARQVGKTSILLHLFPKASYVTLDDPQIAPNADKFPEDFLKSIKTPAIIDEAQYAPGLFKYIKLLFPFPGL